MCIRTRSNRRALWSTATIISRGGTLCFRTDSTAATRLSQRFSVYVQITTETSSLSSFMVVVAILLEGSASLMWNYAAQVAREEFERVCRPRMLLLQAKQCD